MGRIQDFTQVRTLEQIRDALPGAKVESIEYLQPNGVRLLMRSLIGEWFTVQMTAYVQTQMAMPHAATVAAGFNVTVQNAEEPVK